MFILLFILSTIVSQTFPAQIKGTYLDLDNPKNNDVDISNVKDAVCRITFNKDPSLTCSATLISSTRLLTAAHCFTTGTDDTMDPNRQVVRVDCGFKSFDSYKHSLIKKNGSFASFYSVTQDITMVVLDPYYKIDGTTPIEVVDKNTLIAILPLKITNSLAGTLNNKIKCIIAGYGLDNNNKKGVLHMAELPNTNFSFNWLETLPGANLEPSYLNPTYKEPKGKGTGYWDLMKDNIFSIAPTPSNHIAGGDSGGPLLCKINNKWMLAGIGSVTIPGKSDSWSIARTDFLTEKQLSDIKALENVSCNDIVTNVELEDIKPENINLNKLCKKFKDMNCQASSPSDFPTLLFIDRCKKEEGNIFKSNDDGIKTFKDLVPKKQ